MQSVIYLLKYACNHNCNFCLNTWKAGVTKVDRELSFEKQKEVIRKVKDKDLIVFSGGEPTLNPHCADLILYAHSLGMKTALQSNGTLITREFLKAVKGKISFIQISLEGLNDVHDKIVGKKSFEKVVATMRMIKEMEIPLHSNITVTQCNIKQIPEYIQYVENLGVSVIGVTKLYPAGMGMLNYNKLKVDDTQWKELLKNLKSNQNVSIRGVSDRLTDGFLASSCIAGHDECTIYPNGDITICPSWPYMVGNILIDDIEKIWSGNHIQNIRNASTASCGACVLECSLGRSA